MHKWFYKNQRGEVATAIVLATFVLLSIATIAVSVVTQNTDRALTTSSRAADSCSPGGVKGHYCEYKSNGFGNPPYCVRVNYGNSCEDVYTRDDSIQNCCQGKVEPPIDTGGSCFVGKACGIAACNDDISGKGASAKCSVCDGGWCAGGFCATCGGGGGGGSKPPAEQPKPPAEQPQQPQQPSCSGTVYAPPASGAQPNCGQFNGKVKIDSYYWNTNCGKTCANDSECTANGAQGWCYGFGDGKKCMSLGGSANGCKVESINPPAPQPPADDNDDPPPPAPQPPADDNDDPPPAPQPPADDGDDKDDDAPAATCKINLKFTDQDGNPISGVNMTLSLEGRGNIATGSNLSKTEYTTSNAHPSGKYTLELSKTGYTTNKQTLNITAPSNCSSKVYIGAKLNDDGNKDGDNDNSDDKEKPAPPAAKIDCLNSDSDGHFCSSYSNCENTDKYQRESSTRYECKDPKYKYCCKNKPADSGSGGNSAEEGKLGGKCKSVPTGMAGAGRKLSCDTGYCDKSKTPATCANFDKNVTISNISPLSNFIIENVCFWKGFSLSCEYEDKTDRTINKGGGPLTYTELNKLCSTYYPNEDGAVVSVEIYYHRDPKTAGGLLTDTRSHKESTNCKDFNQGLLIKLQ